MSLQQAYAVNANGRRRPTGSRRPHSPDFNRRGRAPAHQWGIVFKLAGLRIRLVSKRFPGRIRHPSGAKKKGAPQLKPTHAALTLAPCYRQTACTAKMSGTSRMPLDVVYLTIFDFRRKS